MVDIPPRSLHPRSQFSASLSLQALYRKLPWTRRFQRIISIILVILLFYLTFVLFKTQTDSSVTHSKTAQSLLQKAHVPGWNWPTKNRQAKHSSSKQASSDDAGKVGHHHAQQDPLVLNSAEELAAVVHFITALRSNAITNVDPDVSVPPELLLGFNIRAGEKSRAELDDVIQNTWFEHPVVIFSEVRSARSREVKETLASYKLRPVPTIIDINERDDADTLEPILYRLTNATSLPVVLVGGKSIGTTSDIKLLHENGELKSALEEAGAVINGSQKRKKRKLVQYNPEKR